MRVHDLGQLFRKCWQLAYGQTRHECLRLLSEPLGVPIDGILQLYPSGKVFCAPGGLMP